MIIAAHQHRIAEISEAVDAHQQKSAGQARRGEAERHRAEEIPSPGAQILRRQLQIGTDGLQHAGDRDIRQREKSDGLRHPEPDGAVEVCLQVKQVPRDEPAPSEEHDESEPRHDGRRHRRQERHHLEKPLPRHICVIHGIRENKAENDRRRRRGERREERMAEDCYEFTARHRPLPVGGVRDEKDLRQRIQNKQAEEQEKHDDAREERRLPEEHFHLRLPSRMLMARSNFFHRNSLQGRKTSHPFCRASPAP